MAATTKSEREPMPNARFDGDLGGELPGGTALGSLPWGHQSVSLLLGNGMG